MNNRQKTFHQWSWLLLPMFLGAGLFFSTIGLFALACMVAPVVMAFFRGRLWCGSYCPRGSFNDILLVKLSRKLRLPGFLKTSWFKLGFLTVMLILFGIQLALVWGDMAAMGKVFLRMVFITTLIAVVLGTVYHQRTWCTVCPMGTLAHYANKKRNKKAA